MVDGALICQFARVPSCVFAILSLWSRLVV